MYLSPVTEETKKILNSQFKQLSVSISQDIPKTPLQLQLQLQLVSDSINQEQRYIEFLLFAICMITIDFIYFIKFINSFKFLCGILH